METVRHYGIKDIPANCTHLYANNVTRLPEVSDGMAITIKTTRGDLT